MSVSFTLMLGGAIGGLNDRDRWIKHFTCDGKMGRYPNSVAKCCWITADPVVLLP